ncbi:MAG: hypothetical protein ABGZ53_26270 [Fuerstiella sp.]
MPTNTETHNGNSLDWRDRNLFPPEEVVNIAGHDDDGHFRSATVTWSDIDGDYVVSPRSGLRIRIESVDRVADRPVHEEELIPYLPSAIRESARPSWPLPVENRMPGRWDMRLRRAQSLIRRRSGIRELAEELGVSQQSILDLGAGSDEEDAAWIFPERDDAGQVIGLAQRLWFPHEAEDGKLITKGFVRRGNRGLYYAEDLGNRDPPILVPEGFSDTAACLSMGFDTIGRPSATFGKVLLLFLLDERSLSVDDIVLVADRDFDVKAEANPGLDGARRTAKYLAAYLRTTIRLVLPPDDHKDIRQWFNATSGGDLSPRCLDELHQAFELHIARTAEVIEPGVHYHLISDDRPVLSLDEWHAQMQQARIASIGQPGHYADFSPTGAGKSHADRALIQAARGQDKSFLLAVPTHANCAEEVKQLAEADIQATAFPELTDVTCQKVEEAQSALRHGLDLVRAVCTACPFMHDQTCEYHRQIKAAHEALVAVCTTARLGLDRSASNGRDVISVHESADTAICGQYVLIRPEITKARRALAAIRESVRSEPGSTQVRQRVQETQQYLAALVDVCIGLLEAIRTGRRDADLQLADLPPGFAVKSISEILRRRPATEFMNASQADAAEGLYEQVDGNTMRGLMTIAQGESWDVLNWEVERSRRRRIARIVVQRHLPVEDHQTWWWQDATGEREHLEILLGSPVNDRTPSGCLESVQTVELVPIDISRKTAMQTVANAIRMTVIVSGCQRLGIIGHKNHIDALTATSQTLLASEIQERIHMLSYYGAGIDRASNQWMECDRLLVLGTPRIGDDAVRTELWRSGNREAAEISEPGWVEYTWEGRDLDIEDEPVIVAGRCYSHSAWHEASLRLTRSAMRQALGRARAILDEGLPATIWTTEALPEYTVRVEPERHTAIVDVLQALWCANIAQPENCSGRSDRGDQNGPVWMSGAEIGRRLGKGRPWMSRVLNAAEEQGLVERRIGRRGWTLAAHLLAGTRNQSMGSP